MQTQPFPSGNGNHPSQGKTSVHYRSSTSIPPSHLRRSIRVPRRPFLSARLIQRLVSRLGLLRRKLRAQFPLVRGGRLLRGPFLHTRGDHRQPCRARHETRDLGGEKHGGAHGSPRESNLSTYVIHITEGMDVPPPRGPQRCAHRGPRPLRSRLTSFQFPTPCVSWAGRVAGRARGRASGRRCWTSRERDRVARSGPARWRIWSRGCPLPVDRGGWRDVG